MDLKDLVVRAQTGDEEAYAGIYNRFREMALAYAYSILGDHDLAEDARQEAFVNAYCDLQALRTPSAFPGWFRQIVRKHAIAIRRKRRTIMVPLDGFAEISDGGRGQAEQLDGREVRDKLLRVIGRLPRDESEITRLFYFEERSLREIGDALGLPEKRVKSRLHAARARLRQMLIEKVKIVVKQKQLAGDRMPRKTATLEAINLFSREIDQLLKFPSEDEQRRAGELVCAKGRMLRFVGQPAEALAAFKSGLSIPALKKDTLYVARLRAEMGLTLIQISDYGEARRQLARSRAMAGERDEAESLRAMILNGLGLCAWGVGDWREGRKFYAQALESSRSAGLVDLEAQALNNLALLEWKQGDFARSLDSYKTSLGLWRKVRNRFGQALSTMNMGIIEENMGRLALAAKHYRQALALGEELGFAQLRGACHANLANLALNLERYEQAAADAERAKSIARAIGDRRSEAIALENLALARIGQTRFADAGKAVVSAGKIAQTIGDRERIFSLELVAIELDLRSARLEKLEERLIEALRTLDEQGYESERPRLLRLQIDHAMLEGHLAEAQRLIGKAAAVCRRQSNRPEEKRIRTLELALAAARRGKLDRKPKRGNER